MRGSYELPSHGNTRDAAAPRARVDRTTSRTLQVDARRARIATFYPRKEDALLAPHLQLR
jgi:hypothetical protein